jgi:hypothetical protein
VTSFPSLRMRGIALITILLFIAGWLGGPARTIALFAALLLVADMLVPAPSAGRLDADEQFDRLVRARWLRRSAPLDVLDASTVSNATRHRRDLGLQTIELGAIAGTVEPAKARQFDCRLRPNRAAADRWKPLWLAYRLGDPVPPVSVYRIDGRYWLCDGHHRVSVLRHQGAATVDALVTEWR